MINCSALKDTVNDARDFESHGELQYQGLHERVSRFLLFLFLVVETVFIFQSVTAYLIFPS